MSSGGRGMEENEDNERKLSNLRAILGDEIPKARLSQVLEASNGSLEHAIEIYFHQMQQTVHNPEVECATKSSSTMDKSPENTKASNSPRGMKIQSNNINTIVNKKRVQRKLSSPINGEKRPMAKQARLDSFFRLDSKNVPSSPMPILKAEGSPKIKASVNSGVPDSFSRNTSISKTISKPTGDDDYVEIPSKSVRDDVESKHGGLTKNSDASADSASICSFQRLCETLQEMTDTTKRLVKIKALETLIREIIDSKTIPDVGSAPSEKCSVSIRASTLSSAIELVLGGMTSKPLNVSGSAVSKALQISLGISRNQISKAYRKYGDIGDCAASFFQKKDRFFVTSNRRQMSILQVAEGLRNISETDGRDAKQHILLTLLRRCQSKMELRFAVRLLVQNMRIGCQIKTILAALAMAMLPTSCDDETSKACTGSNGTRSVDKSSLDAKDAVTLVQKTYDICPNIPKIVSALLEGGLDQMKIECSIQVMTPIAPMLAHPIHSLNEINDKMGDCGNEATMEWKYDGMRCQAHYNGSNIQLFSRHMLNMTDQFPDVANFLKEALKNKDKSDSTSFVIDAEIVGIEGQGIESRLLPFQDLSTRRKKMDDGKGIRVKVFAFDLMYLNGESLVNEELFERRTMLHELFVETEDFSFVSSQQLMAYDESKIKTFLSEAVENGAEGLMVKLLGRKSISDTEQNVTVNKKPPNVVNSFYEAGTRSHSWLKVKRDYIAGYSDTIDVVPIGAWWGSGRKAQKSFLSPILLAIYDDEEDVYRSICRCMTFTDAMYESMREFYFNGTMYPSCVDSQALQNPSENPSDKAQQKPSIEGSMIIDDGSSCDDQSANNENEEECEVGTKNDETDEYTNTTDRVNCFPNRPSSAFVITNESPPIWFKPMEVFEVAFADLSLSRQHTAAAGLVDEEGRGVALRFPRFKRRRPDKKPEQATTSIEIAQLFAKQSKIKNGSRSFQANHSK